MNIDNKGKIFCGKNVFAKIAKSVGVNASIEELTHFNVTFIKHDVIKDNDMLSLDPESTAVLKELEGLM